MRKTKKTSNDKNIIPSSQTLIGAERNKTDRKTNVSIPSDKAVEEMRKWSEQRQQ